MSSKVCKNDLSRNPPIDVDLEFKLLAVCAVALLLTLQLPYDKRDGNLVPSIVFGGNPSMFCAFVLALNFMFFGSLNALTLRNKYPKLSRCLLLVAVVSMATAAGIVAWLTLPKFFKDFAFVHDTDGRVGAE